MKKDAKILIIDDEERDIKAMSAVLKRAGFSQISTAKTEFIGLELVKTFKPDMVIIDVVLNKSNGFDICKKIKNMTGVTPIVIMITGHLDAVDTKRAVHSGADEIIEKTLGFKNIAPAIERFINRETL